MAYAFCTLLTSDAYLPGVLTLAHALRLLHPKATHPVPFKLVCLATPETVSPRALRLAAEAWDFVVGVEVLEWEASQADGLELLGRRDLALVLTKLHAFRLTDFAKVVFLDADTLPLKPLSHLFALPYEFAAAPDTGWPDCFNSGVMVLTPSEPTFAGLRALMDADGGGSFDGGDQGVLNSFFDGDDGRPSWHRLSFAYNVTPTAAYTYAPAYTRFGPQIAVVHFIGRQKPWDAFGAGQTTRAHAEGNRFNDPAKAFDYDALVGRWWSVFNRAVAPRLRVDGGAVGLGEGPLERLPGGIERNPQGGYVGLPLDGRDDLVRPSQRAPVEPERPASPPPPPPPPPRAPSPEQRDPHELQKGVPYFLPWDPATQDPPKTGVQMLGVFPPAGDYGADWAAQAARDRSTGSREWVPDVPEELRHGRGSRTPADEGGPPPPAVFPWESRARPAPTRVFPGEPRSKPTAKIGKPRPDLPPLSTATAGAPPACEPGVKLKQSFAEAMAGPSRNAWDADPAIQAYASRLTSPPVRAPPAVSAGAAGVALGGAAGGARGGRAGGAADVNRSREQSRDGGADGDDEDSTGGDESDDEGQGVDEPEGHPRSYSRDPPGGGAGGGNGNGGGNGGGGSRSSAFGGHSTSTGTHAQGHGHHHSHSHSSAQHHSLSRAVQTAPHSVRHAATQSSPIARSAPLPPVQPHQQQPQPQQQQQHWSIGTSPVPSAAPSGPSTPPLSSRLPTSAETSTLNTPSRASTGAGSPPATTTAAADKGAFNTHFAFDLSRKAAGAGGGHKRAPSGRSWDPAREVDAFREQTRRFLGAH